MEGGPGNACRYTHGDAMQHSRCMPPCHEPSVRWQRWCHCAFPRPPLTLPRESVHRWYAPGRWCIESQTSVSHVSTAGEALLRDRGRLFSLSARVSTAAKPENCACSAPMPSWPVAPLQSARHSRTQTCFLESQEDAFKSQHHA